MMTRVLELWQGGHRGSGRGFFRCLHAWLDAFQNPGDAGRRIQACGPAGGGASAAPAGQVLAFPVRGEALVIALAGLLRSRIAQSPRRDLFDLAVVREPSPHLRLDQASYVEFEPGRAVYRLIVALCSTTALTIETEDFDQIVAFVVEYVNDRLAEFAAVEGPS
jgi:hypothetical protein